MGVWIDGGNRSVEHIISGGIKGRGFRQLEPV